MREHPYGKQPRSRQHHRRKQELQAIIEKQLGKSVELHMLVAEDHQQTNLTQITVDQAIRQNIHMDVQIEEEPGSSLEE